MTSPSWIRLGPVLGLIPGQKSSQTLEDADELARQLLGLSRLKGEPKRDSKRPKKAARQLNNNKNDNYKNTNINNNNHNK